MEPEILTDDFDDPWKEAKEHAPLEFVEFFFADIRSDINEEHEFDTLSEEVRKSSSESEEGKRIADKVFKFWTRDEDPMILHSEIQYQWEADFPARMHTTNQRLWDRFGTFPVTVVLYGDDNPIWAPDEYVVTRHGCTRTFTYRVVKLLSFKGQVESLLDHPNPFALMVVAHLKCRETRQHYEQRAEWKFRILQKLYERNLSALEFAQWYKCLDWLLKLPERLEEPFLNRLRTLEQEKQVECVTSAERIGLKKGRNEGMLESIALLYEKKFSSMPLELRQRLATQPLSILQQVLLDTYTATAPDQVTRSLPNS